MEYPPNPSQPFRVDTIAPPLITLLALATLQPLVVIVTSTMPMDFAELAWRVRFFALVLGTAPQIGMSLVVIAAIGLFSQRYLAVRGAAIGAFLFGLLLIPVLIFDLLDILQLQQAIPLDQLRYFRINAIQTSGMALLIVPVLFWMGRAGLQAGKRAPTVDIVDALMINQEPAPGPIDPRVNN